MSTKQAMRTVKAATTKATATKAPATKRTPAKPKAAVAKEAVAKAGVPADEVAASKQASKVGPLDGKTASSVVEGKIPEGRPADQREWQFLVIAARNEHKAYEDWRKNGQPGGRKAEPKRPHHDRLLAYRAEGMTRQSLPEGVKNAHRQTGERKVGSIPAGKTSAGLDRQTDEAIVAWVQGVEGFAVMGNAALHNRFRKAGFGANAKRFGKLADEAKATAVKAPAKVAAKAKATKAATTKAPAAKVRGRKVVAKS